MLYPEDLGNLARVKDKEEHQFFKKYGESMPIGAWNHPGTKQGVYMMGPNAEYLEGKFAGASDPADMRARMQRALQRWDSLRKEKNYTNSAVPAVKTTCPPGITGELIFKVNSRDMPRGGGDRSGARYSPTEHSRGGFLDYIKWAWNENWIGLPRAVDFVPQGTSQEPLNRTIAYRICQQALVDNVRGQVPDWSPGDVKLADIKMRRLSTNGGITRIEYTGRISLDAGSRGLEATLYGEGEWNLAKSEFNRLDLVFVGSRRGAARFNRRENDPGPAPMGVTLSLTKF